jgi:hypothetical protein
MRPGACKQRTAIRNFVPGRTLDDLRSKKGTLAFNERHDGRNHGFRLSQTILSILACRLAEQP